MVDWLKKLNGVLESEHLVILVTVVAVRGSAPREIGAKLLFSQTKQWGTIGGGNLEYKAIALARDMYANRLTANPAIHSFALGPSLGQCCGGHVELMFEWIDRETDWVQQAIRLTSTGDRRYWICRSLSDASHCQFVEDQVVEDQAVKDGQTDSGRFPSARHLAGAKPRLLSLDSVAPFNDAKPVDGADTGAQQSAARWWCELLVSELPEVWVFGAGHVGRALHEQLNLLPCKAVAIDSRDDLLQTLSPSAHIISTDSSAGEVESAPAGAWFVVMTHSHALDFDICHAVLQRADFAYLGLIGSMTKRATFANRLAHRGIEPYMIDRLISPIGLTTIQSRLPQLIALGVAADLAQQWQ